MLALKHCPCGYILNSNNDKEATDDKECETVYLACHNYNNWVVQRRGFMPRPKPAQNVNAVQQLFNHFESCRESLLGAGQEILYAVKML